MKRNLAITISLIVIMGIIAFLFMPNIWTTNIFSIHKTSLIVGGHLIEDMPPPVIQNNEVLLPLPAVQKFIDPTVHWDKKVGKIIFTTKEKVVRMKTDKLTAMVNSKPVNLNIPAQIIDKTPYIPIQFLSELLKIDISWVQKNNAVILDKKTDNIIEASTIADKADVRRSPTVKARIVAKNLPIGHRMRIFSESNEWYNVRLEDGTVGFIEKKKVQTKTVSIPHEKNNNQAASNWTPEKGKLSLVWEYVNKKSPDTSDIKRIEGLDIVSPTWFAVIDKNGTVSNKADIKYVDWAHKNNYKVWALVSNSFDKDLTKSFLNNSDIREEIIKQLLMYAKLYKLDGINIDFENMYMTDKDIFTQFVKEMTPLLKEQGLMVSVDVTLMSSSEYWSKCFDRKALAETVDYMMLMAYDQHWGSSPVSGSVAQLSWVEHGIVRVLEEVPNEKLVLGLPFYTRLWKEEVIDGERKVSSKAITMEKANSIIKEKKPLIIWDEISGQNYAEYAEGKIKYKIWLEDKASINLKSSLVHKYKLAGAASWRRGFETPDIWEVLADNLKNSKDYFQWANANKDYLDKKYKQ